MGISNIFPYAVFLSVKSFVIVKNSRFQLKTNACLCILIVYTKFLRYIQYVHYETHSM